MSNVRLRKVNMLQDELFSQLITQFMESKLLHSAYKPPQNNFIAKINSFESNLFIKFTHPTYARIIGLHLLKISELYDAPGENPTAISAHNYTGQSKPTEAIAVSTTDNTSITTLQEQIGNIANITYTEQDITLSSYPQSPTHWDIMVDYISFLATEHTITTLEAHIKVAENDQLLIIPIDYDGQDFPQLTSLLSMTASELIDWHTSQKWHVAFMGFTPGFAYLRGNTTLTIPRKTSPNIAVPPGSVALGGPYCGIYPTACPGGWYILGTTSVPLWDLNREPANLISPRSAIQFEAQ